MNIHVFLNSDRKLFKVIRCNLSTDYIKLKYCNKEWLYISSRIKTSLNLSGISHFKSSVDDFSYYVNDSSCKSISKLCNKEYEDLWNIVHDLY